MNDLGYEFGDFPLNQFFWKHMHQMKTPAEYLAIMALTFEAANLDFAHFYENVFREHGDIKSANILKVVYDDEAIYFSAFLHDDNPTEIPMQFRQWKISNFLTFERPQ